MDARDYAEAKGTGQRRVLDFTLLSNPVGPCTRARSAMRKALKGVHLPADPKVRHLRRYIARGEGVAPENIVFGAGSTQLLDVLMAGLGSSCLLVPSPVPPRIARLAGRHGLRVAPFPLTGEDGFALDVDALIGAARGVDAVVVPNPHPLTGTVVGLSGMERVVGALSAAGTTLVIDEALAGFSDVGSPIEAVVRSESAVILRSFSLFHALAGLCLGYAIGGEKACGRFFGRVTPGPANTVAAAGAIASLKDGGFPKRTAAHVEAEKAYMAGKLGRIEGARLIETACNFLLVAVAEPAERIEARLSERAVLVRAFEEGGTTYIRVPLRRRRENALFAKALAWALWKGGTR